MRARLGTGLLVPAGALCGHAAAYAVAGRGEHAALHHGYLATVAAFVVPLALAALACHAYEGTTPRRQPSLGLLLVLQSLLFLSQESVEHLLGGHGMAAVAASPAVRVGLLAQAVVAGMILVLVGAAGAAGRAVAAVILRLRPDVRVRQPLLRPLAVMPVVSRARRSRVSGRGPPSVSLA